MSRFHSLKIQNIQALGSSAVQISFEVPKALKDQFKFKAGQYLSFKHELSGQEVRRDYSICSSPTENKLQIGVKQVKDGFFSVFANQELKEGDTLQAMEPQGRFIYDNITDINTNKVAIAAGSGITPVLSIIKHSLANEKDSKFLLIYGNKTQGEAMFLEDIKALEAAYPERLSVEFVFSQEQVGDYRFGRIDRSIINFFLKNKYKETKQDLFFICGPGDFIEQTKETLLANEISENKIRYELFTSSSTEAEVIVGDGTTEITVVLDDEETTFNMSQDKLILDAALDEDLDAPYSCRGGICSTCMAIVTEGEAKMRKNEILTDNEVAKGYILTCQAQPITPTITVNYDDI